jgi:hypothetical protein
MGKREESSQDWDRRRASDAVTHCGAVMTYDGEQAAVATQPSGLELVVRSTLYRCRHCCFRQAVPRSWLPVRKER